MAMDSYIITLQTPWLTSSVVPARAVSPATRRLQLEEFLRPAVIQTVGEALTERMFVCSLLNAGHFAGKLPAHAKSLVAAIKTTRAAWAHTSIRFVSYRGECGARSQGFPVRMRRIPGVQRANRVR